jgi:hypothetical protein
VRASVHAVDLMIWGTRCAYGTCCLAGMWAAPVARVFEHHAKAVYETVRVASNMTSHNCQCANTHVTILVSSLKCTVLCACVQVWSPPTAAHGPPPPSGPAWVSVAVWSLEPRQTQLRNLSVVRNSCVGHSDEPAECGLLRLQLLLCPIECMHGTCWQSCVLLPRFIVVSQQHPDLHTLLPCFCACTFLCSTLTLFAWDCRLQQRQQHSDRRGPQSGIPRVHLRGNAQMYLFFFCWGAARS